MARLLTLSERGVELTNKWAKYKNGMTTESWNNLKPKLRTKEDYVISAKAYMKVMSGVEYNGVIWDIDANGVNRVRFVTKTTSETERYKTGRQYKWRTIETVEEQVEIPHWDFSPFITDISNVVSIEKALEIDMFNYSIAAE